MWTGHDFAPMETIVSVVGMAFVMLLSLFV